MKGIKTFCAALSLATGLLLCAGQATAVDFAQAIPDEYRASGYAIGLQAYSFRMYTFLEAVDKTVETGGKVIELYPGQRFSTATKDLQLNHNAPEEIIGAAKKKLEEAGIKAVAYGVVPLTADEAENRKVFDFCKKMGIPVVVSEPEEKLLPRLSELAKEYDIPIALHNHPQPSKYWDPKHVLEVTKDLNEYVGSCADTGHWMRSGVNPLEAVKMLQGRIISMHIKDLNKYGPDEADPPHDVPFGTGQVNMPAILRAITQQGFKGPMSIEYETDWYGSMPEIAQCIGYVRGFGAAQGKPGMAGKGPGAKGPKTGDKVKPPKEKQPKGQPKGESVTKPATTQP